MMKPRYINLSCILLATACCVGCGCHDTGIEGDSDIDPGPWDPPIESLGEPGWRDSTEPWCSEAPTLLGAFDIWSDTTAVYIFGDFFYNDGGSSTSGCPSEHCYGGGAIYRNGGDGWNLFWERGSEDYEGWGCWFTGIPGEQLLVVLPMSPCEFRHVFGVYWECALPGGNLVRDIAVVNESLAYAIMNDRVIYWDGREWAPYPAAYTPYEVFNIWADDENIFCSGPDGTIISLDEEDWRVHDTGTLRSIGALWGFGGDDVWAVGGGTGLMHYDGSTWEEIEWPDLDEDVHPCGAIDGIVDIWGTDGIIFFHTPNQLVTWDGVEFSVLGYWPMREVSDGGSFHCEPRIEISAIWGNSPEEVFLAVRDPDHVTPDCGAEYVLWWDGSEFHWF